MISAEERTWRKQKIGVVFCFSPQRYRRANPPAENKTTQQGGSLLSVKSTFLSLSTCKQCNKKAALPDNLESERVRDIRISAVSTHTVYSCFLSLPQKDNSDIKAVTVRLFMSSSWEKLDKDIGETLKNVLLLFLLSAAKHRSPFLHFGHNVKKEYDNISLTELFSSDFVL